MGANSEYGNFVIEDEDSDSLTDRDQLEDNEELCSTLDMNFFNQSKSHRDCQNEGRAQATRNGPSSPQISHY